MPSGKAERPLSKCWPTTPPGRIWTPRARSRRRILACSRWCIPMLPADRRRIPRLHQSPGFLAAKVAQRGTALMEASLRPHGLLSRQYGVLEVVSQYPGLAQQEIASALELDRTTVSELIDGLTAAGWVERQPGTANRRANA